MNEKKKKEEGKKGTVAPSKNRRICIQYSVLCRQAGYQPQVTELGLVQAMERHYLKRQNYPLLAHIP